MSAKLKGSAILAYTIGIAAFIWVSAAVPGAAAPNGKKKTSCEECHSQIATSFHASVHARTGIDCVTCHGGDPSDPDETAMAPRKGFRGKPSRQNIPQFCARCHEDRAQMHQYGLSTHQFEDYKTSMHGRAWQQGDTNVAVCTDCHSSHKILAPDDPDSTIYPDNVATTCSRCHSDKQLMAKYGLPADQFDKYKESVHAQVLAGGGRQSAPSCATCHGSHTALPPGAKDIPNICSRCHVQEKGLIDESAHGSVFAEGEMSCQDCHEHHGIQHPTDEGLQSSCLQCHGEGSPEVSVGKTLHEDIARAREDFTRARSQIDALEKKGAIVEELREGLQDANTGMVQAIKLQHTLKTGKVEQSLKVTESILLRVNEEHKRFLDEMLERKLMLIPLWAFIGLMAVLLYWKRRRYEHDEEHAEEHHP